MTQLRRKAIGDSGEEQRLIRTVPREGVRFVGQVRSEQSVAATNTMAAQVGPVVMPPDRPLIAVMLFQNMSGDHDQEYFADGLVDDVIAALSRMRCSSSRATRALPIR